MVRFVKLALLPVVLLLLPSRTSHDLLAQSTLTDSELEVIAKLPTVSGKLNRGFKMTRTPVQLVRTTLSTTISTPSFDCDTWIFALPHMPTTSGQEVRKFTTTPDTTEIFDISALHTPIRRVRIDVNQAELKKQASFQADAEVALFSRSLTFRPNGPQAKVEPLSEAEKKLFLRPSVECDYTAESFVNWKAANKFSRNRSEGEVRFAQRVFKSLVTGYQYLYVPEQNRAASALCQTTKTDCGGLSVLFASIMRSEGIPARVLTGRWAKSARDGETIDGHRYYQYHVIAEFYADGVGWVPLDPSSAILHDKTPTKLQFFGQDPGNFVVLHVDTGIEFDTELYGNYRSDFFQMPLNWVRGTGSLDDRKLKEVWEVSVITQTNP